MWQSHGSTIPLRFSELVLLRSVESEESFLSGWPSWRGESDDFITEFLCCFFLVARSLKVVGVLILNAKLVLVKSR